MFSSFSSSSKPVLRFAAVRTLNKVAMTHPMAVTNGNIDMESLISDQKQKQNAEEFSELSTKTLRSLPYGSSGQTFVAFEEPDDIPAVGKFSNMLKFIVKEVDPITAETEEDGVEDKYQLEDREVVAADYALKALGRAWMKL